MNVAWFFVAFAICIGFFILLAIGFVFLIIFIGKRGIAPARQNQLEEIIEEWADDKGYELLEARRVTSRDHPFADRFGFGFGKKPAMVQEIEVRDRKGRVRRGWAYIRVRMAGTSGTAFGGFVRDSLEVAWED
jgi:hypothetical protein